MKKIVYLSIVPLLMNAQNIELPSVSVLSDKLENTLINNSNTIDAVDENKREITQTNTMRDLSVLIPTANVSGIGNRNDMTLSLRGLSNYLATQSSVAIYVDDVPIPFSYGYALVDMNHIKTLEVIKGAQGTLYGKGAQAGVINIYTHTPAKEFHGSLSGEFGTYKTQNFHGLLLGATPIENLNYSLSFSQSTNDGYTINSITGNQADSKAFDAISAKLNYKPTQNLDITLSYTQNKSDDGSVVFKKKGGR